jgi:metal-dependent amidase/aminoacylase/carboxypeptidase family protein
LGAADRAQGIVALPHTPDFDVADEALVAGVKVAASVLLNFLDRRAQV